MPCHDSFRQSLSKTLDRIAQVKSTGEEPTTASSGLLCR
jgi:hypothetical protein